MVRFPVTEVVSTCIGELFKSKPKQWGLRGDPYLWADMARVFRRVPFPENLDALSAMLEAAFLTLTSQPVRAKDAFYVDRYAHGGMSSGLISPGFWRETGFPILQARFLAQQGALTDAASRRG